MNTPADEAYSDYSMFRIAWSQYNCSPNELTAQQREEAERRVNTQLMIESAVLSADERQGVILTSGQLKSGLEEIKGRFDSAQAFEDSLEQAGLDIEMLTESLQREQLIEAVLDRVCSQLPEVSDEEAEIFYYMHPERFQVGERREAKHILITINEDYPENKPAAALHRIGEIQRRVEKKPSRFEEQAQKHSECPTSMHGGLIGTVEKGQLYPELEAKLFTMQQGEISEPVQSSLGYHLLYCGQIDEPRTVTLQEVLPKIRTSLEQRQRSRFQKEWIADRLRQQAQPAKVVNA